VDLEKQLDRNGLLAEVRSAVREEALQQQREWAAKQEEAQRQQLDCLTAAIERLFAQHLRHIEATMGAGGAPVAASAPSTSALVAASGAPPPRVQFAAGVGGKGAIGSMGLPPTMEQPRLLHRHHSSPIDGGNIVASSPVHEEAVSTLRRPSPPPGAAPPPTRPVVPAAALPQLPAAALLRQGRTAVRSGPPSARHQQPRTPASASAKSRRNEAENSSDNEPESAEDRIECVIESPAHVSPSVFIEQQHSDFKSEATQENERWKHQWQHYIKNRVSRRLDDINSGPYLAHKLSGMFGLRAQLGQLRQLQRGRTEQSLQAQPQPPKTRLEQLVDSPSFHFACAMAIVANAIFIGVQTDISMKHALQRLPDPQWFRAVSQIFVAIFLAEVLLRLGAKHWRFFLGDDWKWNVFDLLLTVYAVAEEWITHLEAQGGFSLTYTRLIRGFRMVRVLRVIRVMRFFRELRLMVCSTMQCFVSLSWAMVLMLIIIFLFTVCFMHAAAIHLNDRPEPDMNVRKGLQDSYGSLPGGMFSLLLAVSGGDDWINLVTPLEAISPMYKVLFSVYVFFVLIGVVNVVTSAFVQRACEFSRLDRDLVIQSEMVSHEAFLAEMKGIFEEVDVDNSGKITWEKFRRFMENDQVQAYFATQQLDTSDARELFTLLDSDGNNYIDLEEFIMGCQKLRGQAKSSDVATLLRENKRSSRKFMRAVRKMEDRLGAICATLGMDPHERQASLLQSPCSYVGAPSWPCTPASALSPIRGCHQARGRSMPVLPRSKMW